MWDTASGAQLHIFEGHEAPVYSVCAPNKENFHVRTLLNTHICFFISVWLAYIFVLQFFFSTSIEGKIHTWLYDHGRCIDDCYAPGRSCSRMSYSSDEKRYACKRCNAIHLHTIYTLSKY